MFQVWDLGSGYIGALHRHVLFRVWGLGFGVSRMKGMCVESYRNPFMCVESFEVSRMKAMCVESDVCVRARPRACEKSVRGRQPGVGLRWYGTQSSESS
jgi:hypothetical protein